MGRKSQHLIAKQLQDLRHYLTLGLTDDQIMSQIKTDDGRPLARSTYFHYKRMIWEQQHDQIIKQGNIALAWEVSQAKDKLLRSYQNLRAIATDKEMQAKDRIDAELISISITNLLLKLESDQSAIALNKELLIIDRRIEQQPQLTGKVERVVQLPSGQSDNGLSDVSDGAAINDTDSGIPQEGSGGGSEAENEDAASEPEPATGSNAVF